MLRRNEIALFRDPYKTPGDTGGLNVEVLTV
jgi:hypothetical protein